MERADIEKKVDMIAGKLEKKLKQTIVKMSPNLFKGLGKMVPKHHMKIPASLLEKIKEKLDNMEEAGMIRKIDDPTKWVNSMVVMEKPSRGLRVCLDPRDLNKAIKRENSQLPTFEEITSRLSGAKLFIKLDANKGYW